MRLVRERRTEAFDELYRRHAPAVAAVAGRVAGSRGDADESVQRAFMLLWERAATLAVAGASMRPWLVTVGRNAALDRVRRARALVFDTDADARRADPEPGPEERALERDMQRDIRRALDDLDDEQRAVVELAYFGGLTQVEIARETGAPLGTVKSRVRLAMQHLRAALAPTIGELA
jgi:RNA polymerase sigma-70 factor (ECF subfamily)